MQHQRPTMDIGPLVRQALDPGLTLLGLRTKGVIDCGDLRNSRAAIVNSGSSELEEVAKQSSWFNTTV